MTPTKLSHRSGPIGLTFMVFKLILIVITMLAIPTQGVDIGDCYADDACGNQGGRFASTQFGDGKANSEVFIKSTCKSFFSFLKTDYKADICTGTSCQRLTYEACFKPSNGGSYQSIEFIK